ncbi:MAG: fused MFS/spermidine synthase [Pseudomonadota bacterium]
MQDFRVSMRGPLFLFLISGFSGLVYEVVWTRMLVLVFGNTTLATSTILASFMAGLALGAYFWGRFADRRKKGFLGLFGLMEIAIGLFALVFPYLLDLATPAEAQLSRALGFHYALFSAGRVLFCFSLLVVPTILMGGAFAVLGKHVIQTPENLGRDTALLYGMNTAGALLGAGAAGFFLIRNFGHSGSFYFAAFLNLLTGVCAVLMDRKRGSLVQEGPVSPRGKPSPARHVSRTQGFLVLAGLGLSGFCALAYEVMWTRLLTLMVDNSIYSFTIILMFFLAGIALGSLMLNPLMRILPHPLLVFGLVEAGIGLSAFFFPFFLRIRPVYGGLPYYAFLIQGILFMVLIPTLLMGMALPLAAGILKGKRPRVGAHLGGVYALNTAGGVLGALSAGFVLMPYLGFHKTALILPALNWLIGGAILCSLVPGIMRIGVALVWAAAVFLGTLIMPGDFFRKKYMQLKPGSAMIYYREGLSATSTVFKGADGNKILYINGIPQVQTDRASMKTFTLMGALPCLLHPEPKEALIITFGAGITSGSVARFADRMDCVELVDEAREIGQIFSAENNRILENGKMTLHINDARHYLQNAERKVDIIAADATHPRGHDSWALFTREFYELVRKRMKEGGIFCQWVPIHGMNIDQYMAVIRTFYSVFPQTSLWVIDRSYSLLMGTTQPLKIDFSRLMSRMNQPEVRKGLRGVGLDNPYILLSHFSMGPEGLKKMLEGFPSVITDDHSRHLFFPMGSTPDEQYRQWPEANYKRITDHEESVVPYLIHTGSTKNQRLTTINRVKAYQRKSFREIN